MLTTDRFTASCLVSSMVAFDLQLVWVYSLDSNMVCTCNHNESRAECQLRVCCAGHQVLACLQTTSDQNGEEVMAKGFNIVNAMISQTCPQVLGDSQLCPLPSVQAVRGQPSAAHNVAEVYRGAVRAMSPEDEPIEVEPMYREPIKVERIIIHLRFGANSSPKTSVEPMAALLALLVIQFYFN